MRKTPGKTHTTRRSGGLTGPPSASSSGISATVPRLEVNGITNIDLPVQTGLAPIGGPVVVVFPAQFRNVLRASGAYVFDQDRVRFTVANLAIRAFREKEVSIRFYPQGKRRSLFPEINFPDLKGII